MTDVAPPRAAGRGRFWRDADGHVVIVQVPNIPLVGWLLFAGLSRTLAAGPRRGGAGFVSEAFLFTWAYLELTQGVNYFRRLLGVAVLVFLIGSHLR